MKRKLPTVAIQTAIRMGAVKVERNSNTRLGWGGARADFGGSIFYGHGHTKNEALADLKRHYVTIMRKGEPL